VFLGGGGVCLVDDVNEKKSDNVMAKRNRTKKKTQQKTNKQNKSKKPQQTLADKSLHWLLIFKRFIYICNEVYAEKGFMQQRFLKKNKNNISRYAKLTLHYIHTQMEFQVARLCKLQKKVHSTRNRK
jgi:fucose permease